MAVTLSACRACGSARPCALTPGLPADVDGRRRPQVQRLVGEATQSRRVSHKTTEAAVQPVPTPAATGTGGAVAGLSKRASRRAMVINSSDDEATPAARRKRQQVIRLNVRRAAPRFPAELCLCVDARGAPCANPRHKPVPCASAGAACAGTCGGSAIPGVAQGQALTSDTRPASYAATGACLARGRGRL